MIEGHLVRLRPVQEGDWSTVEAWGQGREGLWGAYQRFQLDHVPLLRQAYQQTGLLSRESGLLLIETLDGRQAIGYVRYTLTALPDADYPHPEVGFGIPVAGARGKGYAQEAVGLLVSYLFGGYAAPRLTAFTDVDNLAAQCVLEHAGFRREGVLRRSMFRDGQWRDLAIYGLLREERSLDNSEEEDE
jgi:RimJ/RimL family protein N-acetyltransferase